MKIIIFAGGYGTRMWPISRKSNPKQFSKIVRGRSFFQRTVARFKTGFDPKDIYVSTEEAYVGFVRDQAPEIPRQNIIIEPERKDLLGAVGLVSVVIEKLFPKEVMFFSWSDHFVSDTDKFIKAVRAACVYTQKTGRPTSINEKPTFASIHNGWLKLGKKIDQQAGLPIFEIVEHVEKPDIQTAQKYFKSDEYLLHTGYGAWRSDLMLSYYKKYAPKEYQGLIKIQTAWGTKEQDRVLRQEYHKFEKNSVEYAIYEKLPNNLRVTIPVKTGWEDAGTWQLFYDAVVEKGEKDVVEGDIETEFLESRANLIIGSGKKLISIVGLKNIVVVDSKDALLVCDMDKTDKVKELFKKLEKEKPKFVR
jgi:mannose-1-phosphate guanylyltransferase